MSDEITFDSPGLGLPSLIHLRIVFPSLIASVSDSGGGMSNRSEYFAISSSVIP
ncbi:MAG: hypothetical protein ACPGKY_07050 [Nitrosopumilus sp.]